MSDLRLNASSTGTQLRRAHRAPLWAARLLWASTAAAVAVALDRADGLHATAGLTAAWWAAAAVVIVALTVPGCLGLTLVRFIVPAAVPSAALLLVSVADRDIGTVVAAAGGAVVATAAAAAVAWSGFGEAMVQGSAYGSEQRLPLRAPVAHAAAIVGTWALWAAAVTAAAVSAGTGHPVAALAVGAPALALGAVLVRTAHRFSRRWLVLVPAGLVVHDHVVLGETLMMPRPSIDTARLAPAGTEALDLTGPASGFALEIVLRAPTTVLLAPDPQHPRGRAVHARSLLVAPTRPGRALRAASEHRIAIG